MSDCEKKYKEALEVAKRKLCFDKAGMVDSFTPNDIYEMFPELKESEDERIRKGIIRNLEYLMDRAEGFVKDELKERIAWLEKQCEQKFAEGTFANVDDVREDFIQEVYRVLDADSTNDRANQIIDAFDSLPTLELEKQGEQKPTDKVEPKFKVKYAGNEYNVFETKDIAGVTYYGIEDEPNHIDYVLSNNCEIVSVQKIANEFAPKFHEGDFVVIQETTYLISKIEGLNVTLSLNGREGIFDIDVLRNAHLYTIEDAKDGDVIYSRHNTESFEWIGIFKSLDKENKSVHFYGFWNNVTKAFKVCGNEDFVLYDDFYPATKEQRDTLMKAMADAGYTFDFEKKKLKKIEDETEIPFGAKDSELQEATYYIPKGFYAEIDGDKVVIRKGEKPTWSEKHIADVFEKVGLAKIVREQSNDALTIALQDAMIELSKVTLQPKPTSWSEEDESWFKEMDLMCLYFSKDTDYRAEFSTWLNSLKALNTWKPSDEQMDALVYHLKHTNENSRLYKETKKLYEQLKKLK